MKTRRTAFWYFSMVVYSCVVLYAIVATWKSLGEGQEYPYLLKGFFLLLLTGGAVLLLAFGMLWARLDISGRMAAHPRAAHLAEWLCAAVVLGAGAALRIAYLAAMPMQPESDFKTYYEIAEMLCKGTLLTQGTGYCDYVAMFPHVLGYPAVLSVIFRLFGVSVAAAQGFNAALAVATAFVIWRVARRLAGRIGGFAALCAAAFWPSQILYTNFVAGEFLFTFLLLCCVWLFVVQLQDFGGEVRHPWLCVGLLAALGALLALAGAVRPMALLFLISAVLCLLPYKNDLPARLIDDIPLGTRLISRGWKRCLVMVAAYLLLSNFVSMSVGYTVDRTLASGSASFGYNLLVGLNTQSSGGWNQEDADVLYQAFDETGSATQAHLTCRDLALQRLKTDPRALLNLMTKKFEVLWGNDDYGASWNILFMDQQGTLTAARQSFYSRMMELSDLFYLAMLILAGVAGLAFWQNRPDASYAMELLFLGTVAMHLLVENQNRYHYHALALLAVFGGIAVSYVLQRCRFRVLEGEEQRVRQAARQAEREAHVRDLQAEEKRLTELRAQAMHAQFDLDKAVREGHVNITVSEAVGRQTPPPKPAQKSAAPQEVSPEILRMRRVHPQSRQNKE
jgi:hypothetical protein